MREERGKRSRSPEHVVCLQMTALGILDHDARRSNMVYQHLVPLGLSSTAMEYDFCVGLFSGSKELDTSHRGLDTGS